MRIDKNVKIVILKVNLKINFKIMNTQIIGIKQLHSTLKKVADAAMLGQSFLVVKNSKPVFKIEPVKTVGSKKYNLKDFSMIKFSAKDKNLSKKIDQIVYN